MINEQPTLGSKFFTYCLFLLKISTPMFKKKITFETDYELMNAKTVKTVLTRIFFADCMKDESIQDS